MRIQSIRWLIVLSVLWGLHGGLALADQSNTPSCVGEVVYSDNGGTSAEDSKEQARLASILQCQQLGPCHNAIAAGTIETYEEYPSAGYWKAYGYFHCQL